MIKRPQAGLDAYSVKTFEKADDFATRWIDKISQEAAGWD